MSTLWTYDDTSPVICEKFDINKFISQLEKLFAGLIADQLGRVPEIENDSNKELSEFLRYNIRKLRHFEEKLWLNGLYGYLFVDNPFTKVSLIPCRVISYSAIDGDLAQLMAVDVIGDYDVDKYSFNGGYTIYLVRNYYYDLHLGTLQRSYGAYLMHPTQLEHQGYLNSSLYLTSPINTNIYNSSGLNRKIARDITLPDNAKHWLENRIRTLEIEDMNRPIMFNRPPVVIDMILDKQSIRDKISSMYPLLRDYFATLEIKAKTSRARNFVSSPSFGNNQDRQDFQKQLSNYDKDVIEVKGMSGALSDNFMVVSASNEYFDSLMSVIRGVLDLSKYLANIPDFSSTTGSRTNKGSNEIVTNTINKTDYLDYLAMNKEVWYQYVFAPKYYEFIGEELPKNLKFHIYPTSQEDFMTKVNTVVNNAQKQIETNAKLEKIRELEEKEQITSVDKGDQ